MFCKICKPISDIIFVYFINFFIENCASQKSYVDILLHHALNHRLNSLLSADISFSFYSSLKPFLKICITFAIFNSSGTKSILSDKLHTIVNSSALSYFIFLRTLCEYHLFLEVCCYSFCQFVWKLFLLTFYLRQFLGIAFHYKKLSQVT